MLVCRPYDEIAQTFIEIEIFRTKKHGYLKLIPTLVESRDVVSAYIITSVH